MSDVICGIIKTKKALSKDSHLEPDSIDILLFKETLKDHIRPVIEYFEKSDIEIPGIDKINREGSLVSPTFIGGATSSTRKLVIPLVFTIIGYDKTRGIYAIAPFNIEELVKHINYRGELYVEYQGNITNIMSWYLTRGVVYPFTIVRFFKLLYYPNDPVKFKRLLKSLYANFNKLLNETLSILKIPRKPNISCDDEELNKYYIVYRRMRTFASAVLEPALLKELCSLGNGIIIDQNVSYMETSNEEAAYYYSAILNYLAYKVKKLNLGRFARDQFGRPLKALLESGLEWEELDWQKEVAKLSKNVHQHARKIILGIIGLYENTPIYELIDQGRDEKIKSNLGVRARVEKTLLNLMQKSSSFQKIVKIVDENTDPNILVEALRRNVIESQMVETKQSRRSKKKINTRKANLQSLEKWLGK